MPSSTFKWTNNLEELRQNMTRGYACLGEPYWDEEEAFLRHRFAHQPATTTLCLGSGFFRELDVLAHCTPRYLLGVEIEPDILFASREVIQQAALPAPLTVGLLLGDILSLPLAPGSFDLVTLLYQGLGNLPTPARALREMLRVCAPGGTILLTVWKDAPAITTRRLHSYALPGETVRRAAHPATGIDRLIVTKDGIDIFSSAIIPEAWFRARLHELAAYATLTAITHLNYCTIVEIAKPRRANSCIR